MGADWIGEDGDGGVWDRFYSCILFSKTLSSEFHIGD